MIEAGWNSHGVHGCCRQWRSLRAGVILLADLLHPVDDLAILHFGNRDMAHAGGRGRAVPMFDMGSNDSESAVAARFFMANLTE